MSDERRAPHVIRVEQVQDLSRVSSPVDGFLRRHRHRAKSVLSDGFSTDTYVVDYVDRAPERRHAVCVLPFVSGGGPVGETQVILRSQMRYPAYLVSGQPMMLETIAGIIEGDEPPKAAAVREVWEEGGLRVAEPELFELGAAFFPSPGVLTERIHVLAVPVPAACLEPGALPPAPTDGSVMEQGAELLALTLDDALSLRAVPASEALSLADAKTEIALWRLRAHLSTGGAR